MLCTPVPTQFQFHHGSIKAFNAIKASALEFHFNSIMVRLKQQTVTDGVFSDKFQFHHGSIKATGSGKTVMFSHNFNSIMVRLKPLKSM